MKMMWMAATLALATALPANAAVVIDQSQTVRNELVAQWDFKNTIQSFKAGSTNLVGASIFGALASETATLTISLWSALPDPVTDPITGGNRIATGSTTISQTGWMDVFWNQVTVTPGQVYYLVFSANARFGGAMGSGSNPYAGGQAYAGANDQTGRPVGYPGADYAFKTFTDDGTATPVPEVPEPASWVMLLLGFGAIGGTLRSRRRRMARVVYA